MTVVKQRALTLKNPAASIVCDANRRRNHTPNNTEARVKALKPRKTAYDSRDRKLRGFGVQILPFGRKRFFIHCQHRGDRIWKVISDPETTTAGEARFRADEIPAAIRRGEGLPDRLLTLKLRCSATKSAYVTVTRSIMHLPPM